MANESTSGVIQSRKDFENNPTGQYQYWEIELKSSFKRLREWHLEADMIQRRYIDDRTGQAVGAGQLAANKSDLNASAGRFRLNLFHSNTKTITNMLYGKLPRIDVSRTDTSGDDDIARVAAEMMERILRKDLSDHGEEHTQIFKAVLADRQLPGLGCARVRYEVETAPTKLYDANAPQNDADDVAEQFVGESAPFDYYYWADMAWGWARSFSKLPWIGFRSYLNKDAATKRFGKDVAEKLEYKARAVAADKDGVNDPTMNSAWQEAEIWEIWDKNKKKVIWLSLGYDKVLDTKKDPLQLSNFYPCPPFFLANPTNALYMPTPDYHMAQDLYNQIDILQTRIAILTEAVKVIGVYDASAEGIKRMFKEGVENDLIPVDNWAMFAEKGGIQGQIDWLPIADVVGALEKLITLRDDTIGLLQQVTGMADVMRGELTNQYEGVGQTKIKHKFASVRVQALSEEFARFVTDLQQIKAEIICRHFNPETIAKLAHMQFSPDVDKVPAAIELLKQPDQAIVRIDVKSETMAMEDYMQLQEERAAYLAGLSEFLTAAQPLIQQDPRALPFLLQMLKWAMAGFKGASDIEGVLDQAIEVMSQPQQQQEPPPSDAEKQGQIQLQLEQLRQQGKLQAEQMKAQGERDAREFDMRMDTETRRIEVELEMQKADRAAANERAIIAAKMEADVMTEYLTSQINAEQADRAVQGEIYKEIEKAKIKVMGDVAVKREERATEAMKLGAASREHDKDLAQPPTTKKED